jgi:C-8 sterol isomerase
MGYLFSPERLQEIARKGMGLAPQAMTQAIGEELLRAYPGHIEAKPQWIFSVVAGATGIMAIFHASLSEYVLIFGTPIGTEGFSGRYRMDIYDFQISGETWTYTEDAWFERKVIKPGEMMHLKRGQVKGFRLPEGGWMLEYGRGIVPMALPLALGDSVFSCMDGTTVVKTLWTYGRLVVRELLKGKF